MQNERLKHECRWYRKEQTDKKNIDCIIQKISKKYPEEVIPQDSSSETTGDESCPCGSKDTSADDEGKSKRYLNCIINSHTVEDRLEVRYRLGCQKAYSNFFSKIKSICDNFEVLE